jgi:hypothetical protein
MRLFRQGAVWVVGFLRVTAMRIVPACEKCSCGLCRWN